MFVTSFQAYCESTDQCVPDDCKNCLSFMNCDSTAFIRECGPEVEDCDSGFKCVDFCRENTSWGQEINHWAQHCPKDIQMCKVLTSKKGDALCDLERQVFCSNLKQCFDICSGEGWPGCPSCDKLEGELCSQMWKNCSTEINSSKLKRKNLTSKRRFEESHEEKSEIDGVSHKKNPRKCPENNVSKLT